MLTHKRCSLGRQHNTQPLSYLTLAVIIRNGTSYTSWHFVVEKGQPDIFPYWEKKNMALTVKWKVL